MFLRRLGKRGTAIVEYAIILAFAAAVGSSFTSDNGMTGSIKSIIGNVNQMLGVAAGKEETGNKFKVDENAQKYADFMNTLVDNVYNELMKYTDENNPPKSVWIEGNGTITSFQKYDGFSTKVNIDVTQLLPDNCPYMPRANTHLLFDENGKITNLSDSFQNDVSRIYLKNISDSTQNTIEKNGSNPYEAQITFNSSTGTFGNGYDYWKN